MSGRCGGEMLLFGLYTVMSRIISRFLQNIVMKIGVQNRSDSIIFGFKIRNFEEYLPMLGLLVRWMGG
jgi:hypothetical protein